MNSFDYAQTLFAVLVALALGDIAQKVHKLVRHGKSVVWDGRVVLSALLATVVVVRMWFEFWRIRAVGAVLVFPFYLSLFVELMILFIVAANSLPDEPSSGCDLRTFYDSHNRTLWLSFALFQASYAAHWLYFSHSRSVPLLEWVQVLGPLGLFVLLGFVRSKPLHYAVPLLLIAAELYSDWGATLT